MTYFADLTDYTYLPIGEASRPGTKNVGWLSAGHAFETGEPTQELLDRLWSYCTASVAQTRGIHPCEFCPGKVVHFAERNGDKLLLGTSEIRVFSAAGDIYAAPTLIYHYAKDHGYKPPEAFIQALNTQAAPPSAEYFDQLAQASLEWRETLASPEAVPTYQPFALQFPSDNRGNLTFAGTSEIRLRDIALLLIGGLIVSTVLGLIGIVLVRSFTDSKFVAGIVAASTLYGSWLLGYEWLAKARGWDSLPLRFSKTRPKVLIIAAACGIGSIVLLSAVDNLLRRLGIDIVPLPLLDILPQNLIQLIFALILIGIIGPLTEELLFRGLLLDWLKQKMNVWAAAVVLSVIFSLLHANSFSLGAVGWCTFGARLLLGLAASALTIKYRSLRPAFVMHATWNAIGCIASVLNHA